MESVRKKERINESVTSSYNVHIKCQALTFPSLYHFTSARNFSFVLTKSSIHSIRMVREMLCDYAVRASQEIRQGLKKNAFKIS